MTHRLFKSQNQIGIDGVQDMVPENMALCHTEYLKQKESEKIAESGPSFWPSPIPFPFSETGHKKSHAKVTLPVPGGRKTLLEPEMGNFRLRNLYKQNLLTHPYLPNSFFTTYYSRPHPSGLTNSSQIYHFFIKKA